MKSQLIFQAHITKADISNGMLEQKIFLFGDNVARTGYGGQAQEMRGYPNSFGVPTKWTPNSGDRAYFSDEVLDNEFVRAMIDYPFNISLAWLASNRKVIIPKDGIGTGLAQLSERAPKVLEYINGRIYALEQAASEVIKDNDHD